MSTTNHQIFTNPYAGSDLLLLDASYFDKILGQHQIAEHDKEERQRISQSNRQVNSTGYVDLETLELESNWTEEQKSFFWSAPDLTESNKKANALSLESTSRGKVAIIPIKGAMQKEFASSFESSSTLNTIQQIREVNNRPEVLGAVLHIDSGGGRVNGTLELGEAIRNSRKPILAVVDEMGCSAAYWVGSQAKEMFALSPTTLVGSIGVITEHTDYSRYLEHFGIKKTSITSSSGANKKLGSPYEALSDTDKKKIQDRLNKTEKLFHKAVKKGRGDRLELDLSTNAASDVYYASDAQRIGLIDGTTSMAKAVKRVARLAKTEGISVLNTQTSKPEEEANASSYNSDKIVNMEDAKSLLGLKQKEKVQAITFNPEEHALLQERIKEANAERAELASLKEKLSGTKSQEEVNALETENATLKTQVETMKSENETLSTKVDEFGSKLEALINQVNKEKAQNQTVSDEAKLKEQEAKDNAAKADEANSEAEKLQSLLNQEQEAKADLQKKIEEQNALIQQATEAIQSLQKEKVESQKSLEQAQTELNKAMTSKLTVKDTDTTATSTKEDEEGTNAKSQTSKKEGEDEVRHPMENVAFTQRMVGMARFPNKYKTINLSKHVK